jgi:predicted TIM-barrel fold metal-dependent hydrolase
VIVDVQSHVFPRAYVELLARNPLPTRVTRQDDDGFTVAYGDVQEFRLRHEAYSPERKLRDMDAAGIDCALISTNMPGPCALAPELALAGARAINDALAETTGRWPDRFAGLASLPWQRPDAAVAEMSRARDELGLRGVVLYSHVGGRPVDDPAFEPVYAHAAARGLPIVLHPTVPTWGEAIKEHWMVTMVGLQVDTSFALLRLILGGVLERHPTLRVVMPHLGGVLPYVIGRVDHQTEVLGRGRERIAAPPSDYLRRVYLDTVSPSALALEHAYRFSGAGRLLFGSDHPWVDPSLLLDVVRQLDAPDEEKRAVLGGNAVELFGLGRGLR